MCPGRHDFSLTQDADIIFSMRPLYVRGLVCAPLFVLCACLPSGGGSGSSPNANGTVTGTSHSAQVSWSANRETSVNSPGGGYNVYYSTTPGFSLGSATKISIPYVSGSSAPNSTKLSGLTSGTYYIKVVAYSALNPPGSTSSQISLVVH